MFTINSEIQQIIKEIRKAPNADFYLRDIKYQCDEEGCWDTGLISIYNPKTKYSLTYACHCERGFNYQLSILHWEIENYYKRPFLNFPRPMVFIISRENQIQRRKTQITNIFVEETNHPLVFCVAFLKE